MFKVMLGLRTTAYIVKDLAQAKAWYTKAFKTEPYFDESFYVGFNIQGYELGLLPEGNETNLKGENVLSYWGVEDIQKELERLIELGATIHEKPINVGGELLVCSVKDPWSNIIGLIYNPYFKLPE
jgi:predicted enzyme related to lactoylglutathione lyase